MALMRETSSIALAFLDLAAVDRTPKNLTTLSQSLMSSELQAAPMSRFGLVNAKSLSNDFYFVGSHHILLLEPPLLDILDICR